MRNADNNMASYLRKRTL